MPGAPCAWGAVDFLLKPFHDGELEAAVIKLRRRMEAEGSRTAPALPERKKGDKSKYVLQAMDYIGQHYGDQNISVGGDRPAPGAEREPFEPPVPARRPTTPCSTTSPATASTRLWSCCGTAAPRCMRWPSGWAIGTSLTSPPHLKSDGHEPVGISGYLPLGGCETW